ncbi:MAG: 3'(2'),5'-bisphosphate nucleotidase CysQ [Bacteroidia bacterium]
MSDYTSYLTLALRAAVLAGKEILSVYDGEVEVELKNDKSPLTIADKLSHQKITEGLLSAGLPVLSEEGKSIDFNERKNWKLFWMVDPLDGTKEFIKKNGEFTVNIALVKEGVPILGVVYAPVLDTIYFGAKNFGSYKSSAPVSELITLTSANDFIDALLKNSLKLPLEKTKGTFTVVASRSHLSPETETFIDELKAKHGTVNFISKGSSLKICLVTEGSADIYPRLAPTMEWDTAAGQAVALYAGKSVRLFKNNESMKYNKENLLNEWFVVS